MVLPNISTVKREGLRGSICYKGVNKFSINYYLNLQMCMCSVPCGQTPPSSPWHGEPAAAESFP